MYSNIPLLNRDATILNVYFSCAEKHPSKDKPSLLSLSGVQPRRNYNVFLYEIPSQGKIFHSLDYRYQLFTTSEGTNYKKKV